MKKEELIDKTNEAISELVYNKVELQKAYNYYSGERDPELYKYLEENFGIGSPTAVEFTPLLKKHVDGLVGEYLGNPILPKISCKDENTITNIARDKQLAINNELVKFLKEHLTNSLLLLSEGRDITDKAIKLQLDKIKEDINLSFISQYEIAALNILEWLMQSREIDFITKLRQLLTDLLITGYTFFRVKATDSNNNVEIEVLNPLNTFIDRNNNSPYVRKSTRAVIREWLTPGQILQKYGKELSSKDLKKLKDTWVADSSSSKYGSSYNNYIEDSYEEIPGYPSDEQGLTRYRLIPVYDVEWIETDDNFVMHRYNTIRIGEEIFILRGVDKHAIRSIDNPKVCGLSINGVYFLNRSRKPFSLILKCAHLLDKYDLLHYYRDRMIANSGTKGSIIDLSLIPASLGVEWPERISKWIAYLKQGLELIDTTQEGRNDTGQAPINTIFNGFDDSLQALAILAVELALLSIEETTCSITGMFRERLNGIQLNDAVTNIKQGVTNSFIITKPYFLQMDLVTCEMLLDSLNVCKRVYKKGITGTIIVGDKYLKVFTALPEHYTITDFSINIISSTEIMEDILTIKLVVPEFVKNLQLPPDIIIDALTSKSLTELKYKVKKAMKKLKLENDLLNQLSQQVEELQLQNLKLQQELLKSQSKIESLDESRLKLESQKILLEYLVNWFKAQTDNTYKNRQMDIQEKRTDVELAQLRDGNPYNDTIRQI